MLSENVQKCGHATVLRERRVIDFGTQATFSSGSHQLSTSQVHNLRECVPEILAIAGNDLGKKWIKRIVVAYGDGLAHLRVPRASIARAFSSVVIRASRRRSEAGARYSSERSAMANG